MNKADLYKNEEKNVISLEISSGTDEIPSITNAKNQLIFTELISFVCGNSYIVSSYPYSTHHSFSKNNHTISNENQRNKKDKRLYFCLDPSTDNASIYETEIEDLTLYQEKKKETQPQKRINITENPTTAVKNLCSNERKELYSIKKKIIEIDEKEEVTENYRICKEDENLPLKEKCIKQYRTIPESLQEITMIQDASSNHRKKIKIKKLFDTFHYGRGFYTMKYLHVCNSFEKEVVDNILYRIRKEESKTREQIETEPHREYTLFPNYIKQEKTDPSVSILPKVYKMKKSNNTEETLNHMKNIATDFIYDDNMNILFLRFKEEVNVYMNHFVTLDTHFIKEIKEVKRDSTCEHAFSDILKRKRNTTNFKVVKKTKPGRVGGREVEPELGMEKLMKENQMDNYDSSVSVESLDFYLSDSQVVTSNWNETENIKSYKDHKTYYKRDLKVQWMLLNINVQPEQEKLLKEYASKIANRKGKKKYSTKRTNYQSSQYVNKEREYKRDQKIKHQTNIEKNKEDAKYASYKGGNHVKGKEEKECQWNTLKKEQLHQMHIQKQSEDNRNVKEQRPNLFSSNSNSSLKDYMEENVKNVHYNNQNLLFSFCYDDSNNSSEQSTENKTRIPEAEPKTLQTDLVHYSMPNLFQTNYHEEIMLYENNKIQNPSRKEEGTHDTERERYELHTSNERDLVGNTCQHKYVQIQYNIQNPERNTFAQQRKLKDLTEILEQEPRLESKQKEEESNVETIDELPWYKKRKICFKSEFHYTKNEEPKHNDALTSNNASRKEEKERIWKNPNEYNIKRELTKLNLFYVIKRIYRAHRKPLRLTSELTKYLQFFLNTSQIEKVKLALGNKEHKQCEMEIVKMYVQEKKKEYKKIWFLSNNSIDSCNFFRLNETEHLDDSIINFFNHYIYTFILQFDKDQKNIHIFNTFFYTKIETCKTACKAYANTQNWINKLDKRLYEYKYVFIPINLYNSHWALVLLYFPLQEPKDNEISNHPPKEQPVEIKLKSSVQTRERKEYEEINQPEMKKTENHNSFDDTDINETNPLHNTNIIKPTESSNEEEEIKIGYIFYLDSFAPELGEHVSEKIKNYVEYVFLSDQKNNIGITKNYQRIKFIIISQPTNVPKQCNSYDCGLYIIKYFLHLCQNKQLIEQDLIHSKQISCKNNSLIVYSKLNEQKKEEDVLHSTSSHVSNNSDMNSSKSNSSSRKEDYDIQNTQMNINKKQKLFRKSKYYYKESSTKYKNYEPSLKEEKTWFSPRHICVLRNKMKKMLLYMKDVKNWETKEHIQNLNFLLLNPEYKDKLCIH